MFDDKSRKRRQVQNGRYFPLSVKPGKNGNLYCQRSQTKNGQVGPLSSFKKQFLNYAKDTIVEILWILCKVPKNTRRDTHTRKPLFP